MNRQSDAFLCIAICTFNRSHFLDICLQKLVLQLKNRDEVTILVVDNNSQDDTKKVVERYQKNSDVISYHFCVKQGLSFARNDAVRLCNTAWLSFLDDDAYPADDWLENNLRIINANKFDAFGGVYLPWYKEGKKNWFKPYYETNKYVMPSRKEGRLLPSEPYFSGGNATFNVKKLTDVGGFSAGLGMNGSKTAYGEEVATQREMAINGSSLGFSHLLIIYHYVPLSKQNLLWPYKRSYLIGRDFWVIWGKPTTLGSLRHYIFKKIKKSSSQTVTSTRMLLDSKVDFGVTNFLYEIAGWAGVIGLIVGAVKPHLKLDIDKLKHP